MLGDDKVMLAPTKVEFVTPSLCRPWAADCGVAGSEHEGWVKRSQHWSLRIRFDWVQYPQILEPDRCPRMHGTLGRAFVDLRLAILVYASKENIWSNRGT